MNKFIKLTVFFIFLGIISNSTVAEESNLKLKITNDKVIKQQAEIFYKNQNYEKALSFFLNLSDKNLNEETLLLISNCFDSLGDKENAVSYLKKAISLSPKNPKLYYNLGILYSNQKKYHHALECFNYSVKLDKKFADSHYNLANTYYELKNYSKAIKYYKKTIKLEPNYINAYYNLAMTFHILEKENISKKFYNLYKKLKESEE